MTETTGKLFEDWEAPSIEGIDGWVTDGVLTVAVILKWDDCLFSIRGTPAMFDANIPFPISSEGSVFTWVPSDD